MSKEGIQLLINQAESIEKEQVQQSDKQKPDYKSAAEIHDECQQKAIWIMSAFVGFTQKMKPESAALVLTDPKVEEGVHKLTAVIEKYPGTGVPPWLQKMLVYREEFELAIYFGGTCYGIYQADQLVKEEKTKQENKESEGAA